MQTLLQKIEESIRSLLTGAITSNCSNLFGDVNDKVGQIASEVAKTPATWNRDIFQMIKNLSQNAILPVAGIVIAVVLTLELVSLLTEHNNMRDFDSFLLFRWFLKAYVAVFLVSHTFDIVMVVFELGQSVVLKAGNLIHAGTSLDITQIAQRLEEQCATLPLGELLTLSIETLLLSLSMKIMAVIITIVLYGRMIEIYCTISLAPLPMATLANREWKMVGSNYLRSLFALAFQGFVIMIVVGIYSVLIHNMALSDNIHSTLFSVAAYSFLLCLSLVKTGAVAKSIFNAR